MFLYKRIAICIPISYKMCNYAGKVLQTRLDLIRSGHDPGPIAQPTNQPTRPANPPGINQPTGGNWGKSRGQTGDQPQPRPNPPNQPGPIDPHQITRDQPRPINRDQPTGANNRGQTTRPNQSPTTRKRGKRLNRDQPPQNTNNPANGAKFEVSAY